MKINGRKSKKMVGALCFLFYLFVCQTSRHCPETDFDFMASPRGGLFRLIESSIRTDPEKVRTYPEALWDL